MDGTIEAWSHEDVLQWVLIALIGAGLGREPKVERRPDQPGDVPLTAADLTRSGRELSYRPRVPIEEGIRHFIRWYEEFHGRKP